MKIENVRVYDLEESIVASGYPMMTDLSTVSNKIRDLKFFSNEFVVTMLLNNQSDDIEILDDHVQVIVRKPETESSEIFLIDFIDLELFLNNNWHITKNGYLKCDKGLFHRLILDISDENVVDHIDRNKHDCRRKNLRICTRQENSMNCGVNKNNTSGVSGVSFRKDKNKWRAYITVNRRQITLGHFNSIDEAIVARLYGEKEYFGEFAPQKHLYSKFGICENHTQDNEYTSYPNLKTALIQIKRMRKLGSSEKGEGHDQALTGIRVAFDLTFSNKAWVELERYRFVEFVSSQSTMHRASKFDIKTQVNEYVTQNTIDEVNRLKEVYLETQDKEDYLRLLYNLPSGFELTARLTTNYRALKTVYCQRKSHRLPEWREFCKWVETLPMFKELCLKTD